MNILLSHNGLVCARCGACCCFLVAADIESICSGIKVTFNLRVNNVSLNAGLIVVTLSFVITFIIRLFFVFFLVDGTSSHVTTCCVCCICFKFNWVIFFVFDPSFS